MASTYTIKYKHSHGAIDWSLEPSLSLAQIQSSIDSGSSTYSLYFEITNYTVDYLNAVLCLEYTALEGVGQFQYASANTLAQNVWFGLPTDYEITIDNITSENASASIFHFGLKFTNIDDMTLYDETLATLNTALNGDTTEKIISLYIEYQGVNTDDNITINTTIT